MAGFGGFGPMGVLPVQETPELARTRLEGIASRSGVPVNVLMALAEAGVQDADTAAAAMAKEIALGRKVEDLIGPDVMNRAYDIADQIYPRPAAAPSADRPQDANALRDLPATIGASVARAGGSAIRGVGEAVAGAADVVNQSIVNPIVEGMTGRKNAVGLAPNPLSGVANAVGGDSGAAGFLDSYISEDVKRDQADFIDPKADLFSPSTWSLGPRPTVRGAVYSALDVFGSMAPVVVVGLLTKSPAAAAAAGGSMSAGYAAVQAEQAIDLMAQTKLPDGRSQLEAESSVYQRLVQDGASPEQALEITKRRAAQQSALLAAIPGALGGAATLRIIGGLGGAVSRLPWAGRVAATAGLSGIEEGAQEVAEGIAGRTGINSGAGMNRSVTEGTLNEAILGAMGGAQMGAIGGAFSRRDMPQEAPPPAPPAPPLLALPAPTSGGTIFGAGPVSELGQRERTQGQGPTALGVQQPAQFRPNPATDGSGGSGGAPAGRVIPSPDPAGVAPMGPVSRIAASAPDLTPVPAPPQRFPDQKPGNEVELLDPETGVLHPAVFLREEPDGAVVRIEGGEFKLSPEEFDAARVGALQAVEGGAKKPATPKPQQPVAVEAPVAQPPQPLAPMPVVPADGLASKAASKVRPPAPPPKQMTPKDAADALSALEANVTKNGGGWNKRLLKKRAELQALAGIKPESEASNDKVDREDGQLPHGGARRRGPAGADARTVSPGGERNKEGVPQGGSDTGSILASGGEGGVDPAAQPEPSAPLTPDERPRPSPITTPPSQRVQPDMLGGSAVSEEQMATKERRRKEWGRFLGIAEHGKSSDDMELEGREIRIRPGKVIVMAKSDGQRSNDDRVIDTNGMTRDTIAAAARGALSELDRIAPLPTKEQAAAAPPPPPPATVTKEPKAAENGEDRFAENRKAIGNFAKGMRVEFDAEGSFKKADGTTVDRETRRGSVVSIDRKSGQGTVEVRVDGGVGGKGYDITIGAAQLRQAEGTSIETDDRKNSWDIPANVPTAAEVKAAAAQADTKPTEAQKEAGNYQMGHIRWNGLDISIETAKGAMRRGKDRDGEEWSVKMPAHYGYVRGTEGADGDHVDIYMGDQPDSDAVVVIDQVDADSKAFDEHKVMLGFQSVPEALDAYRAGFSDGRGNERLSGHKLMTVAEFKTWLENGDTEKPVQADTSAEVNKNAKMETAPYGASNTLVSADRAAELRARLKDKLKNQLNAGIDPEILAIGAELAVFHIEAGARRFMDLAKAIADDLGTTPAKIKPYLRSWYNGARDMMEDAGLSIEGMDDAREVGRLAKEIIADSPPSQQAEEGDTLKSAESPEVAANADQSNSSPSPGQMGEDGKPESDRGRGTGAGSAAGTVGDRNLDGGETGPDAGDAGMGGAGAAGARSGGQDGESGSAEPEKRPSAKRRKAGSGEGLADVRSDRDRADGAGRANYHIADPDALFAGGPKARFAKNRAAMEAYQRVTDEDREPTPAELDAMAAFTGWGSFGQELFQGNWGYRKPKDGWATEDQWLRDHLGKEGWESAQASIINAHYTDPPTVQAIWSAIEAMGFKGGRVLEPAMGIGNFFGMMPRTLEANSQLFGIELENATGTMAKMLYPRANVRIMGYEKSRAPDGFYDLVIGNWPFANVKIADRRYDHLSPSLHDYFFVKALDQVRPGGLVVGITSAFSMDGQKNKGVRQHLARNAELVAAFRLPSGAFEKYAGTKVVTDLIILRKRDEAAGSISGESWVQSAPYTTPSGDTINVNQYFIENPAQVLGTLDSGSGTTYGQKGMIVRRPDDIADQLAGLAARVPSDAYREVRRGKEPRFTANTTTDRRFSVTIGKDGALYQVLGDQMAPLEDVARFRTANKAETENRMAQVKALVGLRRAAESVLEADQAGSEDADTKRKALKKEYQGFLKAHGRINDSFGLSLLRKLNDPNAGLIAALETAGGEPSPLMERPTVRATRKLENPSIRDAFVMARNENVRLDLDRVADLSKKLVDEVIADLLASKAIYRTPGGGYEASDAYLSGNVRQKLREAREALADGEDMQDSVNALQEVQPPDVPYFQIEARFGADWIKPEVNRQFIIETLGLKDVGAKDIVLTRGVTGWSVEVSDKIAHMQGLSDITGAPAPGRRGTGLSLRRFIEATMNTQTLTVTYEDEEGTHKDTKATEQANQKAGDLRQKFGAWVWSDPERRVDAERDYNEVMNAVATPRVDGSFLEFPGMALKRGDQPFNLRQHQANAIWKGILNQRGIYGHEVGTGKTITMTGIAVESRRYGLARKPLLIAHNANSAAVAAEAQETYPGAKILYVNNLAPGEIDAQMARMATEDWDLIVIPHSLLDRMALTYDTLMEMAADDIAAYEREAIEAAEAEGQKLTVEDMENADTMKKMRLGVTAKEMVKARARLIQAIEKQAQRASREGAVSFERLGVDMILVDESHEFKKPPLATRMQVKGLNTGTSNKSLALRFLTSHVKKQRGGTGVHVFTGTPITNTLAEIYHQMFYVMDDIMAQNRVDSWDGFFKTFADTISDVELTSTSEFENVERLAAFINVSELRRMAGQFLDIVFASDMPEFTPRATDSGKTISAPDLTTEERDFLENGRVDNPVGRPYKRIVNDIGPMGQDQKRILQEVVGHARAFKAANGKVRREIMMGGGPDAPIVFNNVPNRASMDARLQEPDAEDHPLSKANRAVKNIARIYLDEPMSTQVLFMDEGYSDEAVSVKTDADGNKTKTKKRKFNLANDIVEKLVAAGVKREEIAIVAGGVTAEKKKAIADAMNARTIRVVIGQTKTLGVGVNMQRYLRAMHHLDAPWMPGDLEQRNGRGERQGNTWNTVLEYRYLTEGLDGRRWQVLAIKDRFIKAFLKAKEGVRNIEGDAADDAETMDGTALSETLSEAAGDPRLMMVSKLNKSIERLQQRERIHTTGIADAIRRIKSLRDQNARRREDLPPLRDDAAHVAKLREGGSFSAKIDGKVFDERPAATEALAEFIAKEGARLAKGESRILALEVQGFAVKLDKPRYAFRAEDISLSILRKSERPVGGPTLGSIEAAIRRIPEAVSDIEGTIKQNEDLIQRLERAKDEPFQQAGDLAKKKAQLENIQADMEANPVPAPSWLRIGAPVDSIMFVDGEERVVTGHRWTGEGWFVSTDQGDVPYLDAKDQNGIALYQDRPFVAPEVSEGSKLRDGSKKAGDDAGEAEMRGGGTPKDRPMAEADLMEITRTLNAEAERHGLGGKVSIRAVRSIISTATGEAIEGRARGAQVEVKAGSSHGTIGVLRHELIHVLRDDRLWNRAGGLFRPNEWRALVEAARADTEIAAAVRTRYPGLSRDKQAEEMVAELYRLWAQGRDAAGPVAKVLARIRSLFEALANALRGDGFISASLVMDRIARGDVGGRGPDNPSPGRGGDFVAAPNGSVDFGEISSNVAGMIERQPAKIRLRVGDRRTGLIHIRSNHEAHIKALGYPSVEAFVSYVAKNYGAIYRRDGRALDLVVDNEDQGLLIVQLEPGPGGDYYEVRTATPIRRGQYSRKTPLWEQSGPRSSSAKADPLNPKGQSTDIIGDGVQSDKEMRGGLGLMRDRFSGLVGSAHWKNPGALASNLITDAMAGKGDWSALALVPGRALFTELGKRFMSAKAYLRTKEEMDALRNDWHAKADLTAQKWLGLRRKEPRANDDFMDLMHRTTLAGIDPSRPDTWRHAMEEAARRAIAKDGPGAPEWAFGVMRQIETHKRAYDALRERFTALPKDFQDLYREVRGRYDAIGDAFEAAVLENITNATRIGLRRAERAHIKEMERIRDEGLEGEEREEAIAEADRRLAAVRRRGGFTARARIATLRKAFESNRLKGPYFPLARFGDYFVTIRDESGKVISFSRFEKEAQQQNFIKDKKAEGQTRIEWGVISDKKALRGQVDPTFVADVENMLAEAGATDEVMDAIWQRWLETLPDQSIRTSKIHRKGREGWNSDAFRAFGSHLFHGAHQLARLKYGILLEDHIDEAEAEARRADDPNRAGLIVNEMRKRHAFTMNPTGSAAVAGMSSAAFVWYLGATPAAALANVSQTTVVGIPMLSARFRKAGVSGVVRELGRAARDFVRGRGQAENAPGLSEDERAALAEAIRRGTIDKTQAHDLASVAETGIEYNAVREKWMRRIGWFFHHAERLNREVTFLAAYRMAKAEGQQGGEAIDTAADQTWRVHFDYQNTSRPRFMQSDVGKILTQFRQFTVNMLWRLARDSHQALRGATKEERAEARLQLTGITLSMLAHAGIRGTWGYGLVMLLLGVLTPGADDDDIEAWLQDALLMEGDGAGVAAWNFAMGAALNGAPGQILGVDLKERIGMPNLWFRGPSSDLEGADLYAHYVGEVLGPVYGIGQGFFRGAQLLTDGEWVRGTEAAVPKVLRDLIKSGRYMAEGAQTLNGDMIVDGVNPYQVLMQASGFTPAQIAERYDANSRLKSQERRITDERKEIHRLVGDAVAAGGEFPQAVLDRISDFNRRYPEYPITGDSIRQSMQSRQRAHERSEFGVTLNPKLNERLRADLPPLIYN